MIGADAMMLTICESFSAAHRLTKQESKCAHLHGHTYFVEVTFICSPRLTSVGMLHDLTDLKALVHTCLDRYDHKELVDNSDFPDIVSNQDVYVFDGQPTLEIVALDIATYMEKQKLKDCVGIEVCIKEGSNARISVRCFFT